MRAALRTLIAILTLTIAAGPVFADQCLMTCQIATRSASTSEHSCHHAAGAPGAAHHLANDARPCDHEHGVTASLSDDSVRHVLSKTRTLTPVAVITPAAIHPLEFAAHPSLSPPRSFEQVSPGRILPLRI